MSWKYFALLCCILLIDTVYGQFQTSAQYQDHCRQNANLPECLQQPQKVNYFSRETFVVSPRIDAAASQQAQNSANGQPGSRVVINDASFGNRMASSESAHNPASSVNYPSHSVPLRNSKFTNDIYQKIARNHPYENVIFSPISLETILALTYTGATGNTANELQAALGLPDREAVLQEFRNLKKSYKSDSTELQMANKLYFQRNIQLKQNFKQIAEQYFDAETEVANFAESRKTAARINNWVENKTHNKIQNLIQPQTLDAQTSAILVNAIYFKGKWNEPFSKEDTDTTIFYSADQQLPVKMMNNEDSFRFRHFPELGAKVLQLPYKDSDLSMLLILPDNDNGLAAVESILRSQDLRQLAQMLQPETVKVHIPKFRITYEEDMIGTLQQLGISTLFTPRAELRNIFERQTVGISKVQHKAYIDVNEAGSEAAAATFNKLTPLSLPTNVKEFRADHPFMFAILSPQAVYFMGHVVNPV